MVEDQPYSFLVEKLIIRNNIIKNLVIQSSNNYFIFKVKYRRRRGKVNAGEAEQSTN